MQRKLTAFRHHFHMKVWKMCASDVFLIMMDSEDQVEAMFVVETILNKRIDLQGRVEYFVKWKGFKQKTWEPIDHLSNVPEMIYEYEQANKVRRRQPEQNAKKIVRQQNNLPPRKKKLTKLARKENENGNVVDLDSSTQNGKEDYLAQSQSESNKQDTFEQISDAPRIKFTRDFPQQPVICGRTSKKMNIYVDQIERVTAVQRRNDKWMARIRFLHYSQEIWEERDIARLLCPQKLLQYYQQLDQQQQR